ncbi:hypothetical protein H5410_046969 [Solanum commersonii]|uniref:F-box/LRR-repeat protein 15/At3g58940/PEG3-like LRR domain-containing protein n=1 Tax=Solanum commersonii TaxID=4109 RepID=A0A9J5XFW7_SOLCO|nr:hypothetical protein H5410_046969 [Solanum commersonii]
MKSLSPESKPLHNKLQEVTTYKFDWENQNWYLSLYLEMHCFICKSSRYFFIDRLIFYFKLSIDPNLCIKLSIISIDLANGKWGERELPGYWKGGRGAVLSLRGLGSLSFDDNMLQTLLNRCSLIVNLTLEHCYGLEKIVLLNLQRIKSVSIKTFRNQHVQIDAPTLEYLYYLDVGDAYPLFKDGNGAIINAPNLVSLEYIGDQIPKTCVDANLQWNCHPRKVILFTTNKMISCFMDRLMNMKSSSHESKTLIDKLQEVTTYKFDWENQNYHFTQNALMHLGAPERCITPVSRDQAYSKTSTLHELEDVENNLSKETPFYTKLSISVIATQ